MIPVKEVPLEEQEVHLGEVHLVPEVHLEAVHQVVDHQVVVPLEVCQIVCTMRFQRVSKILTPRRRLQKT